MKKSFLFITCEEAYHICDKSQYGESSMWEKIKLNLRYVWCRFTRAYVQKNIKLTKAMRLAKVQSLEQHERDLMVHKFNQLLKHHT